MPCQSQPLECYCGRLAEDSQVSSLDDCHTDKTKINIITHINNLTQTLFSSRVPTVAILHCWRPICTVSDVETLPLVCIAIELTRRQTPGDWVTAQYTTRCGGSHGQISTIKATQDACGASWRGSGQWLSPWPGMREKGLLRMRGNSAGLLPTTDKFITISSATYSSPRFSSSSPHRSCWLHHLASVPKPFSSCCCSFQYPPFYYVT